MKNLVPSWIRVPVVFLLIFGAVEFFIDSGSKPAFIEYPAVMLFLLLVLLILIAIEAIIGALENVMLDKLDEKAKAHFLAEKEKTFQFTWLKETYQKLLGSTPIESESEIILDASDLKSGQAIFQANCVACHMADGGGGIGPNLTDKHWILGGDIKSVFKTISEGGRSGKGMIAWKAQLKPSEMAQVASYVLSFQGTTPANPKAAEGDIKKKYGNPNKRNI